MTFAKRFCLFLATLVSSAIVFAALPADAKGRIALVIGNNNYPNLAANQQLTNAVSDARAMRDTLKGLGFEVIYGENLNRSAMVDRLSELTSKLSSDDTALVFYAGHGVSFSGANYLLPIDIPAPRASGRAEEGRLADQAVAEAQIIDRVTGSGAAVTILVLDACRDNPLQSSDRRSLGSTRGLGQGNPARGVFSIYSAGHGQAALDRLGSDDRSPNSVFTRIFMEKLKTPGLSLQAVALQTRSAVVDLTRKVGHDQFPAYYDQIIGGEVYLAGLPSAAPAPAAPVQAAPQPRVDPDAAARSDYALAERANTRAAYDAFVQRYPTGYYSDLARSQRERLAVLEAKGFAPKADPAPVSPAVPQQPQAAAPPPNLNPVAVPNANFPTKPVKVIIPFAPGGAVDVTARVIAEAMTRSLGQSVLVENRSGQGGAIGMQAVASAAPDGHTLIVANNAVFSILPSSAPGTLDVARDFAPIGQIASSPLVLVISQPLTIKSLRELIDYARANSGKLTYASVGTGTLAHLAAAQFEKSAGIQMMHIAYRGAGPALNDLAAGHMNIMFADPASIVPLIQAGTPIRPLAVAGPRRHPSFASTPTMAEAGFAGFEAIISYGMLAPRNTPPAVIAKLNAVLRNAAVDSSVRQRLSGMGLEPASGTAEDFTRAIAAETARWGKVIREAGINPN